jgi:hypothetical protein
MMSAVWQRLEFAPLAVSVGEYDFTVTIAKDTRTATATQRVVVRNGTFPSVTAEV